MEWAGLKLVTEPEGEPLSLEEARDHLRAPDGAEDAHLEALISAARKALERRFRRAFLTQTWEVSYDNFPAVDEPIQPPIWPLQSVASIKYIDPDGVEQTLTLAGGDYQVDADSRPGRILPPYGGIWPYTRDVPCAVRVQFVAGYGTDPDTIDADLLQALQLLVAHWFENREPVEGGNSFPAVIDEIVAGGIWI